MFWFYSFYASIWLLFLIIGFLMMRAYQYLLRRERLAHKLLVIPAWLGGSITLSVLLYYTAHGFGPGKLYLASAAPLALLSLVIAIIQMVIPLFRAQRVPEDKHKDLQLLVWGILMPITWLAPLAGTNIISDQCDAWNRQDAISIVAAQDVYKRDMGEYAQSLDILVHHYLPAIPYTRCGVPYRWLESLTGGSPGYDFAMIRCKERIPVLIMWSESDWSQRYNLDTHQWSSIRVLEDECGQLK